MALERSIAVLTSLIMTACAVAIAGPPGPQGVSVIDLGEVPLIDTGAVYEDVAFDVPTGAASALLHCGGFGDVALGMVAKLVDPNGVVVWDAGEGTSKGFRSEANDDGVTILLPLTPEVPLVEGKWDATVLVGPGKKKSMRCQLLTSPVETTARPVIRLAITLVGFEDGYASEVRSAPYARQMLRQLRKDFASAGVGVEATWIDFDDPDEARWAVVDMKDDDTSEFNGLLRRAAPQDPRAIPVFFVKEIANHSRGGATILGMSAGPPGTARMEGTSKGGLVVSAMDLEHTPKEVSRILAHELGHFLGLFHTTEKKGTTADLLPDTPVCEHDDDGNGVHNSAECKDAGFDNMMWWTMGAPKSEFTPDQKWVLRHHPLVQP